MTVKPVTKINIRYFFVKEQTRLDKCVGCNETIYSDSYSLMMDLQISKASASKCCSVCESCYNLLEETFKENYPLSQ